MSKNIFYGWWVVIACFVINVYVGGMIFFGFTAFFQPIREELGWSYTQISLATSLRGLEMGVFAPVVGFLVSRYGPRKLMFAGMVTLGIALIILSRVQSLLTFYIAFFLVAFGAGGCTSVVTLTAIANWFHKKVGIAMGIVASGFGASGLLIPVIVHFIAAWGWRPTLVILAAGTWLLGIPLTAVIRDRPERYGYLPDGKRTISQDTAVPESKEMPGMRFADALKDVSFLYLNLVEFLRLMSVTAVVFHIMPYLQSIGMDRPFAGMVAASVPLVSIAGRFGFGWLSDRYERRVVMCVTLAIMGIGLLAFSFGEKSWGLWLFVLLFSPGFGGGAVLRGAILRDHFGRDSFGKLMGITMGSGSLGGIVGPALAGMAFDYLGTYKSAWVLLCALCLLASAVVLRIRPLASRREKRIPAS